MSNRRFYCGLCERWHGEDPTCAAQRPTKAPHVHEKWQLQESAQGGMYCAACGEAVPADEPYSTPMPVGQDGTRRETCPEWNCPDLSTEDRRDGKKCPDHPCTCNHPDGSGA